MTTRTDTLRRFTLSTLVAALLVPPLSHAQTANAMFQTAEGCVSCHNGLVSEAGEDSSLGNGWRPTMMANAARDPYWHAGLRREVTEHPEAAAAIENECARCHMPLASLLAVHEGRMASVLQHLPARQATSPEALLSLDGVSCAACHQLQAEGLGSPETFSGKIRVDTTAPYGQRPVYGPYAIDPGRTRLMRSAAQFEPVQGEHIQQAELCAGCHTLVTHSMGPGGKVIGELPEQMPYVEWQNSDYGDAQPCQDCHMPEVDGELAISSVVGQPRENVSRHSFRGANFLMPLIFNRHRAALGVTALPQEFEAASLRSREFLSTAAAELAIEGTVEGGKLELQVAVTNLAGHKLPTAYPSRRVWLHLTVRDRSGSAIFESGAPRADGQIAGNDNDVDASRFEPHHAVIESADLVQIYEPIMVDSHDRVTTGLLSAVRYIKDNRVLPMGFENSEAPELVQVRGAAVDDADFEGGSDKVLYRVTLGESQGPYAVEAELWYQPIGYRWAHNLEDQPSDEAAFFVAAFDALAGQSSQRLTHTRTTVRTPVVKPVPSASSGDAPPEG